MTLIREESHLTPAHGPEMERLVSRTHAGMAHFAGSGPVEKTCRDCAAWSFDPRSGYHNGTGAHGGALRDHRCSSFRRLTGKDGNKVPHHASACRHFEPSPVARPSGPAKG